jgi:hypothetical protein
MRLYVFTLTGACLFLFLCPPAHGQTSSKAPCGDPQKAAEDKDPIAAASPRFSCSARHWTPAIKLFFPPQSGSRIVDRSRLGSRIPML